LIGINKQYNPTDSKKFKSGNCGNKIVIYEMANPIIDVTAITLSAILNLSKFVIIFLFDYKDNENI
jgi:hypothetical protein